jgi:hypothetical protein
MQFLVSLKRNCISEKQKYQLVFLSHSLICSAAFLPVSIAFTTSEAPSSESPATKTAGSLD